MYVFTSVHTVCVIQQWVSYIGRILACNITGQENAIKIPKQTFPHFIEMATSNSLVIYKKFAGKNDQQESHASLCTDY
jgi:hypothetical protein